MTVKLYDRAGMNVTTPGTGTTLSLGSALGAVAPNICSYLDFGTAGAQNGDTIRVLLVDNNTNMEVSTFTYNSVGPTLSNRTVELSSNGGSPISLSGSAQAFIIAGAADILTNFNGRSGSGGAITPTLGDYSYSANTMALPQSYLAGLQLSNDGGSPNTLLDISAGQCRDSTNATNIVLGAFTKSVSGSWAAGSGANGMGQGLTVAASTWYHVFAIINNSAADVYFDTDAGAANKPASTTAFRRIGSIKTDGSSHILAFTQTGELFQWSSMVTEMNAVVPGGTGEFNQTLIGVPSGVIVTARCRIRADPNGSGGSAVFASAQESTQAPGGASASLIFGISTSAAAHAELTTNTSAQIKYRSNAGGSSQLSLGTMGWTDRRGRDN